MTRVISGMIILGLTPVLGCVATRADVASAERERTLTDAAVLAEVIDAIQAELLAEELCVGGERLRAAFRQETKDPRVIRAYYSVPGVLTVSREAYVQNDGCVLLADSLAFRDVETRWSTKPVDQEAFERVFEASANRITFALPSELTAEQQHRHEERVRRKCEALQQP